MEEKECVHCTIVGDGAVGKTTLITSFTNQTNQSPTDSYHLQIPFSDGNRDIVLRDTVGNDDHDHRRPVFYPSTSVFILCFSVINPTSFLNISTKWYPEIRKYNQTAPVILCATKVDLRMDGQNQPKNWQEQQEQEEMRRRMRERNIQEITKEEGKKLAKQIGAFCYIEVSRKQQESLQILFSQVIQVVEKKTIHRKKFTGIFGKKKKLIFSGEHESIRKPECVIV